MNTHIVAYEDLVAYAAGELDEIYSTTIAAHILICDECGATVAHYQQISALVRADDSVEPSFVSLARAQAIFANHYHAPRPRWWMVDLSEFFEFRTRFSRVVVLVFLILLNVLLYGDTALGVTAVQNALIGDALYPAKMTSEEIQLAVSFDSASKIQSHLGATHNRANEIAALAALGRTKDVSGSVSAYEKELCQIVI